MNLIFYFFILTLGFINVQDKSTLKGKWILVCYTDIVFQEEECTSISGQKYPITIEFIDYGFINQISLELTARTTTNDVSGEFKIHDSNKITMENVGGSKKNELTKFGRQFVPALSKASSFTSHKDTLTIFYENDTKAMKFIPAKPGK